MGCVLSQLASKFTFFPPSPATYTLKTSDDGKLSAVFTASSIPVPIADEGTLDVLLLDTNRGNKIVAFYLRNPLARLTVLYSHGNATDLGQLFDLFLQLKANLRANLIGYDYSGYGASTGKPSESNTYSDIEAVYECLQTEYGISQEDLILYGQSVGSGPTLHLAAKLPRLRGVVLHSAILSGLRVVCHVKVTFCFDIYKNVNKIQKVKCPVLVIHGTDDDVVNVLHGNGLWKMAREPYEPLWIKGGGHCNLELYPDYIQHLCRFMQEMENITTEIRLRKIRQSLGLHKGSHAGNESASTSCSCGIKFCQLKCPECLKPSCTRCCCRSKCPECSKPRCTKCCWPKCPECFKPRGTMCCCQQPKCLKPKCLKPSCSCRPKCSKPSCTKCCCLPKCPECSKLSCTKCCCLPKCPECPKLSCTKCCCLPKCPESSKLCCTKCCCLPKCPECSKLSCTKCCCLPKCPECPKLSCTKCCCLPKCPEWKYRCLDCKCKSPICPMPGCLCWC